MTLHRKTLHEHPHVLRHLTLRIETDLKRYLDPARGTGSLTEESSGYPEEQSLIRVFAAQSAVVQHNVFSGDVITEAKPPGTEPVLAFSWRDAL